MSEPEPTPVFFHEVQLEFKPLYEWAFGQRIKHPETTARAESILSALLEDEPSFSILRPSLIPRRPIETLHDAGLLTLYRTATGLDADSTFYPSVFPKNEQVRPDPERIQHAGYYCFDSGTPLNAMTLEAASWSAACAHEAAVALRRDKVPLTYALSRPPGHHATRRLFGGYSYFNNAAIAARYLRRFGRVAILDIDFHHGNGTQNIFWRDPKVLFVSIHGDPREFYPYFAGFSDERGAGAGAGYTINLPLPGGCEGPDYLETLQEHAFAAIDRFRPEYLVVSAGHDTYVEDPVGHFALVDEDFERIGAELGRLGYPTLVVQEGGYCTQQLGRIVHTFLRGFRAGIAQPRRRP